MIDFSQLKNVQLQTIKKAPVVRTATPKLPEGENKLRIFHTGKVYPSAELVASANLEYGKRVHAVADDPSTPLVPVNNGIDIFSSKNWSQFPADVEQEFILATVVPKREAKVALFGSTKYDPDSGEPTSSVTTQGTSTFVKTEMLDMLSRAFGIDWSTTSYVDVVISYENTIPPHHTQVYFIPKMITKGAKAGSASYVRREELTIAPLDLVHTEPKTETQLQAEATRAAKKAEEVIEAMENDVVVETPDLAWADVNPQGSVEATDPVDVGVTDTAVNFFNDLGVE